MMNTNLSLSIFQELKMSLDFDILMGRLDSTKSIDLIVCVLLKFIKSLSDSNSSLLCRLSSPASYNESSGNLMQGQTTQHIEEPCGAIGCAW